MVRSVTSNFYADMTDNFAATYVDLKGTMSTTSSTVGNPTLELQINGSHYYRELGNTQVHLDCTAGGAGAQLLPKSGLAAMVQHSVLMKQWHGI